MDNNYLKKSTKHLESAEHMFYFIYPLIKENRLFLNILEETYNSIDLSLSFIINHELKNKKPYKNQNKDLKNDLKFIKDYRKKYNLTNENINLLKEIIDNYNYHKKSAIEFVKNEKIIIFLDNQQTIILDKEKISHYIKTTKDLLNNIKTIIFNEKI